MSDEFKAELEQLTTCLTERASVNESMRLINDKSLYESGYYSGVAESYTEAASMCSAALKRLHAKQARQSAMDTLERNENRRDFNIEECERRCNLSILNTATGKWLEAAINEIKRLRTREINLAAKDRMLRDAIDEWVND